MVKMKPRFRHFWRNNKNIIAMYITLLSIVPFTLCVIFRDVIGAINWFVILGLWILRWRDERVQDAMCRAYEVDVHAYKKCIENAFYDGQKSVRQ